MKLPLLALLSLLLLLPGCNREDRQFRASPPTSATGSPPSISDLYPGGPVDDTPTGSQAESSAFALNEGKRMYEWFNCVGCHFHGGGGIGPPLMDDQWIYGSDPENIFATIVEGRPNGMPSFRNRLGNDQVWQLVAYVRSLSGLNRKDIKPTRNDDMWFMPSESRKPPEKPKNTNPQRTAQ
jgi:cytochrome c oxidase cbb3-type subunit III